MLRAVLGTGLKTFAAPTSATAFRGTRDAAGASAAKAIVRPFNLMRLFRPRRGLPPFGRGGNGLCTEGARALFMRPISTSVLQQSHTAIPETIHSSSRSARALKSHRNWVSKIGPSWHVFVSAFGRSYGSVYREESSSILGNPAADRRRAYSSLGTTSTIQRSFSYRDRVVVHVGGNSREQEKQNGRQTESKCLR
jgi:hypothetical protein